MSAHKNGLPRHGFGTLFEFPVSFGAALSATITIFLSAGNRDHPACIRCPEIEKGSYEMWKHALYRPDGIRIALPEIETDLLDIETALDHNSISSMAVSISDKAVSISSRSTTYLLVILLPKANKWSHFNY